MTTDDNGSPTFVRISNQMVYAELQATRADIRDLRSELDKQGVFGLPKRVRSLELKFYGLLAAVVTALTVVVATGVPGK